MDRLGDTDVALELQRITNRSYGPKQLFTFTMRIDTLGPIYAGLAHPIMQEFSRRWLFGSPLAVANLVVMSAADDRPIMVWLDVDKATLL